MEEKEEKNQTYENSEVFEQILLFPVEPFELTTVYSGEIPERAQTYR